MFELTVYFKHEIIGMWQRFRINRVRINRARPVFRTLSRKAIAMALVMANLETSIMT